MVVVGYRVYVMERVHETIKIKVIKVSSRWEDDDKALIFR